MPEDGAGPDVSSNYDPTATKREHISQRIVSFYRQMQPRNQQTSSKGNMWIRKRKNDRDRGMIVKT